MIIDTFGGLPDREVLHTWLSAFCRFKGYLRMFGKKGTVGGESVESLLDSYSPLLMSTESYVACLDDMEVEAVGLWVHVSPGQGEKALNHLAQISQTYPGRFLIIPSYDKALQKDRARLLEEDHARIGLSAACLLPILDDRLAEDKANWPLFETCARLGLPVWIHTVNTWSEKHPSDFCHPSHADRVACQFPELKIILGHGGWPWVAEAVAVAWRHENVYIEPSAFRWKYLATPGSGWEPLLRYGDTTIADKVLFGSLWPVVGTPLGVAIDEAKALPLKPETLEKWMRLNARRLYGLGEPARR